MCINIMTAQIVKQTKYYTKQLLQIVKQNKYYSKQLVISASYVYLFFF